MEKCAFCLKIGADKKCANCDTFYCSKECQRNDWKKHKVICKKNICCFCNIKINDADPIVKLNCGHNIHLRCSITMDKYLPINKACRVCNLNKDENEYELKYRLSVYRAFDFEKDVIASGRDVYNLLGCQKKEINEIIEIWKEVSNPETGNNMYAQYNLGAIYENGLYVDINLETSYTYYIKSAENGHSGSQCNIGSFFLKGVIVKKNIKKAIEWFEKSADQGTTQAMYNLGTINDNIYESIAFFEKAAEGNFPPASYNLGIIYCSPIYEDIVDFKKGIKYFEKSAMLNFSKAQYKLGLINKYGLYDVEINIKKAKFWLQKALENSYDIAQDLIDDM